MDTNSIVILVSLLAFVIILVLWVTLMERKEDEDYLCYKKQAYKNGWAFTYKCEGIGEKKCKHCIYHKNYERSQYK